MLQVKTVCVDGYGERWLSRTEIAEMLSISRPTAWRLLKKMRAIPKYRGAFLDLSSTLKRVRERDLMEFVKEQNLAYLKK